MAKIPATILQHFIGLSDYERRLAIDKASRELGMTFEQIEAEIENFQSGGFNQDKSVVKTPIQEISRTQPPLLHKSFQNSPKNNESPTQSSNISVSLFFFFVIIVLLWFILDSSGRGLVYPSILDVSWLEMANFNCGALAGFDDTGDLSHSCRESVETAKIVIFASGLGIAISLVAILFNLNQTSSSKSSSPKEGGPKFVDDSHRYRFKYDPSHSGQARQTRATQAIVCPYCKAALGIPEKRPVRVTCPACAMETTFES